MANQKTRLGEISGGSIHPRDVIPPLMQELRAVGGDAAIARALQGSELGSHLHHDTMDWFGPAWRDYVESDDAAEDVSAILDELNNYAPPGTYYGIHPGDGACYGLWADEGGAD